MNIQNQIFHIEDPNHFPVLTAVSSKISFPLVPHVKKVISEMKAKLQEISGVGLAAPQIGEKLAIIAVQISQEHALLREHAHEVPMTVLMNPQYKPLDDHQQDDWEACFSINDFMGKVRRHFRIAYSGQDENGNPVEAIAEGFFARVLQHEIDHIYGTLISNRLEDTALKGSMKEMVALRKAEMSPDKQRVYEELLAKMRQK